MYTIQLLSCENFEDAAAPAALTADRRLRARYREAFARYGFDTSVVNW